MTDTLSFLKKLISTSGLSGYETDVRRLIEEAWQPLTDELRTSRLGSLYGLKKSNMPISERKPPSVLLAAHMDAIGLMVTTQVGDFLHVTEIGGLDPRVLPGQLLTVHGREDIPAVLVQPPDHLLPHHLKNQPVPIEYLLVDTGLAARTLSRLVRVGDVVSFAQTPLDMGEKYLAGHSLDNRAAVAVVTECLQLLQHRLHDWDVWAVATVQEEETMAGARTSAYELQPDIAIAIDVTFAKGANESSQTRVFPLGEGITIGWGANIHPAVYKQLKDCAERSEIPFKIEPIPHRSGTDAWALQTARAGIPTAIIGIPLRYMHTVVEMVSLKDIQRAARLLADWITLLEVNLVEHLSWDEEKV